MVDRKHRHRDREQPEYEHPARIEAESFDEESGERDERAHRQCLTEHPRRGLNTGERGALILVERVEIHAVRDDVVRGADEREDEEEREDELVPKRRRHCERDASEHRRSAELHGENELLFRTVLLDERRPERLQKPGEPDERRPKRDLCVRDVLVPEVAH